MTFQPSNQQAYAPSVGTSNIRNAFVSNRDPTVNDINYPIGQFWQNQLAEKLWYLNNFSSTSGFLQATWLLIAIGANELETLSDTANTPVSPTLSTATPPNNIQLTNLDGSMNILSDAANNRILFSANNSGQNWQVVTTDQTASDNQGYFTNAAGNVNIALPATSLVGDTFEVCQMSSTGSWTITQAAGQSITILNVTSTVGVGGLVTSTGQGTWIMLVCNVANTGWFGTVREGVVTVV